MSEYTTRRDYKDRLFRFIFGSQERKGYTLELYNALNGTAYDDPDELELTTIAAAIDESIEEDILRDILVKHKGEVTDMVLTEFNEERHNRTLREEGIEEGRLIELMALVQEGLLTAEQAASRIGKDEMEFKALMESNGQQQPMLSHESTGA